MKLPKRDIILLVLTAVIIAAATAWSLWQPPRWYIIGSAPGSLTIEGVKVYLEDDQLNQIDSTIIRSGQFELSGRYYARYKQHLMRLVVRVPHTRYVTAAILEPGQTIYVDLTQYAAGGTPLNDALSAYMDACDSIETEYYMELRKLSLSALEKDVSLSEIDAIYAQMQNDVVAKSKEVLEAHPNDLVGVQALVAILERAADVPSIKISGLIEGLGPEILQNDRVKRMRKSAIRGLMVKDGNQFFDATLTDANGKPVRLSKYAGQGKFTILGFWASWCRPCTDQLTLLNLMAGKYSSNDLEIVGIQVGGTLTGLRNTRSKLLLNWPQLLDSDQSVAEQYSVAFLPEAILLDREGYILASHLSGKQLPDTLSYYLGYYEFH